KLFPDGSFNLLEQQYGSTPIASGSWSPDAKGKQVQLVVSDDGVAQLEQFLLAAIADAATTNGVTVTNADLMITKLKVGKIKIDANGQLGTSKLSASGPFAGTVNGITQSNKFSSSMTVIFGQKHGL